MRIWYQSSAPLGKDPLWKPYEESLARHVQGAVRSGTTIDIHGLDVASTAQERSHYVEYLNTAQWISNARISEKEGYDALAGGCMQDPGSLQIREVVDIPVVFAAETSFHLACLLAHKFSLLGYNAALLLRIEELIKQYGLWERYVPTTCFNISIEELREGLTDATPIVEALKEHADKAIDAGADILVPSCNCLNMVLVDSGTREIEGVPVLDNVGVVVKMAELLVDMKEIGVVRSKKGFFAGLSKEELADVWRLYGV
jgi:allantoin racemase